MVVKAGNHNKRQIITINVVGVNERQGLENNQSCAFWFLNDAPARELEQIEFRIIFYSSLIGRTGAWGRNISSPRDTPGFSNQRSSVSKSHT